MVLDHHRLAGYPLCLAQERHWILGMVDDIDQHHDIERAVQERNRLAIKGRYGDLAVVPDEDIDALEGEIGAPVGDRSGQLTVAAADIENARRARNYPNQVIAQSTEPAPLNVASMHSLGQSLKPMAHFLRIPIKLAKKLESSIWKPNAARVAPGMTNRIVRE